jgi:hypothetical protein
LRFTSGSQAKNMESLKQYLIDNFEGVFILVILTFVSAIVWLTKSTTLLDL